MNLLSSEIILDPPKQLCQSYYPLLHFDTHSFSSLSLSPYLLNTLTGISDFFMAEAKVIMHCIASHKGCQMQLYPWFQGSSVLFVFVKGGITRHRVVPVKLSWRSACAGWIITKSSVIFANLNCWELKFPGSVNCGICWRLAYYQTGFPTTWLCLSPYLAHSLSIYRLQGSLSDLVVAFVLWVLIRTVYGVAILFLVWTVSTFFERACPLRDSLQERQLQVQVLQWHGRISCTNPPHALRTHLTLFRGFQSFKNNSFADTSHKFCKITDTPRRQPPSQSWVQRKNGAQREALQ